MQYALCIDDEIVWEASTFANLPRDQLNAKKRNLICVECKEFAWFRKDSSHGHPAHFCAHHTEECNLKVDYVLVDDPTAKESVEEQEVSAGEAIVIRLDKEEGEEVDVKEVEPPPVTGIGGGGKRYAIKGNERESLQHFTLRRILHRLVQSPNFRTSNQALSLFKSENEALISGPINEIITSFEDITRNRHHDQFLIFWGPIATTGRTHDGKIWLNSSDRHQGTSVAIFEDVAKEFLSTFKITDLDDLEGAHVLIVAKCMFATTGKPVIWCASPKYIIVRRYRDKQLQAQI